MDLGSRSKSKISKVSAEGYHFQHWYFLGSLAYSIGNAAEFDTSSKFDLVLAYDLDATADARFRPVMNDQIFATLAKLHESI